MTEIARSITRRQFIASGVAAPLLISSARLVSQSSAKRVVIAGAGLAGLSAAYELAKLGYKVTVIEARMRSGGRVFTLRDPFADGLYVETGGESLGNGYKRFLVYAAEFGIEVDEISEAPRGLATMMKGQLFLPGQPLSPHPYGLSGEEAQMSPPALLSKHLRAIGEEVAKNPAQLAELDKLSLAEALRARGVSARAIELMNVSLNYNDIETVSAAGILRESRRRASGGTKPMRVRGGNDRLTRALAAAAEKAGAEILYGAMLKRLASSAKGIAVGVQPRDGVAQSIEADEFISTLPATTLREVVFDPVLPEAKARALRELPYTRVTKIFLQARRKAWDEAGYGSGFWTDTAAERILAMPTESKSRGIFTVWLDGNKGTLEADKLSDADRLAWGARQFKTALPKCADAVEGGATISWANDPFVRGAYAHFQQGQLMTLRPHLAAPIGRLHFAGEHTAEKSPGMEGALESAARVVEEITGKAIGGGQ